MKEYKLVFKSLSTISKLPSAQTIFGAVCHIILNTQGEEAFQNYIQSFEKEPLFVHSSMFPQNLLPMINYNIFTIEYINNTILNEKVENQLSYLQKMKSYKKIAFMSQKIYDSYILTRQFDKLQNDLVNHKNIKINNHILLEENEVFSFETERKLNTHVNKKDYYMSESDDRGLYYDDVIFTSAQSEFYILVKTNKDIQVVKDIFKYSQYFGFGSRHSVGKNSFELIKIEEVNHKPSHDYKILLSPSTYDSSFIIDQSKYQINSIQYRPSKMYINQLTHQMSLFKEGSYMRFNKEKEWSGKIITSIINDKPVYYYGVGYLL